MTSASLQQAFERVLHESGSWDPPLGCNPLGTCYAAPFCLDTSQPFLGGLTGGGGRWNAPVEDNEDWEAEFVFLYELMRGGVFVVAGNKTTTVS